MIDSIFNDQLELKLAVGNRNAGRGSRSASRPRTWTGNARWWFAQMRQTVDRAIEFTPNPGSSFMAPDSGKSR